MRFEVDIRRSPDEVWAYLIDYAHEVDWQQGVVSSRSDPAGSARLGTVKTKVRRTPLGNQRFTVRVTRFDDAAREWEDVVEDGMVAGSTGHYRVEPTTEGSRVHLDVVMTARGFGRLLSR